MRWYVVRNMHGALLRSTPLPAGVNLKRTFVAAMLEWLDASAGGTFFVTRGVERRMIGITPTDPGATQAHGIAPTPRCASCED